MAVPCEWSSSMSEVIVTSFLPTSCFVTFSSTTLIISDQPIVSLDVLFVGEPSRKQKKDSSDACFISMEEMWTKFQKYFIVVIPAIVLSRVSFWSVLFCWTPPFLLQSQAI